MKLDDYGRLESLYDAIQCRFPVATGSSRLAEAMRFGTNRSRPVHRWFHFKEGFSANVFDALGLNTDAMRDPQSVFLDPFCGSGTTLVAGDLECHWNGHRIGVEVNPFIAFVAATKVAWRDYDPAQFARCVREILSTPLSMDPTHFPRPALSSFGNPEMFDASRLNALLDTVQRIKGIDLPEQAPLLLGVAAAAERLGYYRKDGRALRILRRPKELKDRHSISVEGTLRAVWSAIAEDLNHLRTSGPPADVGKGMVVIGDGRTLILDGHIDAECYVPLMAYSPPYLNHIDYTEVYKIELWLLGLVSTQEQMLDLRRRTLRSHASVGIGRGTPCLPTDVEDSLITASAMITTIGTGWHRSFKRLALAYLEDMHIALQRQYELLQPGGHAICVVGNSAHGSKSHRIPIATDLWIARLAETVGFSVEKFVMARQLSRRDHLNRFLRESVIVLSRSANG